MDVEHPALSPVERLALSRGAILRHFARRHPAIENEDDVADSPPQAGTWAKIKYMAHSWWVNHPASYAFQVVSPALHSYAEERPFKLLGMAAAVGAASVVIRPWTWLSLTALVMAPLKSPRFTAAALGLFTAHPEMDSTTLPRDNP